ncbi:MAG: divalent-cation tolerance protein CutA [Acidobacteriaceae bacterium]|nr:divalent-cation tolerance protein CutA [Acidobacteriaceae bacterium]
MTEKTVLSSAESLLEGSACVVFSTCPNEEEALRLARALVDERLCACVNVLPGVRSIYRWQGAVEDAHEHLLLIKTSRERLLALERRMSELHSYDTPEVIAVPIAFGSRKYLDWLENQL